MRVAIVTLFLIGILGIYLSLNYSSGFNNFVFSNILNPYDPLKVDTSLPVKKDSSINEYWKDPRGLFPIFAYNLPEKTKDLNESLKIIEKDGINLVINSNKGWIADANKVKSAFEKFGDQSLKLITLVENECKNDFIFKNSNDETNTKIKKYLNQFNGNYIYGWYLWDEPGSNRKACTPLNLTPNNDNADINTMSKQIRSDTTFNKKLDFVNLFPTYWDGTPNAEAYEKYIDAFISSQEFKPRVLCLDHYPLLKTEFGGFRKDYYSNLDIIRKKSIQYNIPFWIIVLASEHDHYKKPTIEEISLQDYSALAYGAKGLGYYLFARGWESLGYKSWILENYVDSSYVPDSLHGPLYVPVKKLNENIQTLGKILMNLNSLNLLHTSDYPNNQKDISQTIFKSDQPNNLIKDILDNEDANQDPKILIGVFEERNNPNTNNRYLLIVNKDVLNKVNVKILLNSSKQIFKFDKETGRRVFITKGNVIIENLLPGAGELFYIE
jgi:hypothetical protein